MPDLIETIKKAAQQAYEAAKPVAVVFGVIQEESPLKINVEQKLLLEKEQLILSRNVTDFESNMTLESGKEKIISHNTLKKGDKVILLRLSGGQQYIVLDRVVSL